MVMPELGWKSSSLVLELEIGEMRKRFRTKVREHDPLRFEFRTMRHHLLVRDVRWVVAVEVGGLADKEVRALGDRDELLGKPRVA